jgi:hypothetical protein
MRIEKNTLTVLEQDSIDHIMDNFDFEKVHRTMEALNWKWGSLNADTLRVPHLVELKQAARKMLREAVLRPEPDYTVATGGFYVQKLDGEELKLTFQLDEWCADLTTGYCPC